MLISQVSQGIILTSWASVEIFMPYLQPVSYDKQIPDAL